MNEETNLPVAEAAKLAPVLTPGGAEIISSEEGFVQTEAEVGAEVLAQDNAAQ